uniref:efflux transporter outer membrane subunit n=1 Tax=Rugamonas sp. TaxID=1926287 RepID=UPI0025DBD3A9
MHALRTLTAAGLTLLLAACADMGHIAPQSHKLDTAALNPGSAIAAAGAPAAWPNEAWWADLHDAQLNGLVAAALADNPTLHVTQARVRQAESLAGVVEAEDQVQVNARASSNRSLYSTDGTAPPPLNGTWQWLNSATVSANYDFDLWGRNRAALAAALDDVQLTSAESQMARLTLETAVVRGYIQLSLEYALADTTAASLAQRQRILDITRRRRAAGLASDIDVTGIETTLPAGRRALEQSEETIALLRNQLAALIGKGPGDGETIARPTLNLQHAAGLPPNLPAELLGRRPDIAAQRWRVEAASQRIAVAKASFYPNINFAAYVGFESFGFTNFLSAQSAIRGV